MANKGDDKTISDAIGEVTRDFTALLQEEMALAKAELRDGLRQFARGAAFLLIAAFIVNAGFLALVASAIVGLAEATAIWLSAFIIGFALAVIGAFLLMKGVNDMKNADLKPDRTMETLGEDARIVRERGR